jgi:acetyl-CoA acetyltransferase/uncharacterized OB-fold protein
MGHEVAIVGIGQSEFGRFLPTSQLGLGAKALRAALADSGLTRADIDGLALHMGWPLGADYDRIAEVYGLEVDYVHQSWTHGRFVTSTLQHAAMAVACGMAEVVACITAVSFTREMGILGGPGDPEGMREQGATHAENPVYGLTSPAVGAAFAMQRYMARYGATSAELAAVPIAMRKHARLSPYAVMRKPMSVDDHQASRMVVDPLHLFDCSLVTDGAAVVLMTSAERARLMKRRPVLIAGMQGLRSGRDEFIFAPPALGINQQPSERVTPRERDLAVYRRAGVDREAVQGFYTYDAFSPLVLFALERFGFCGPGEAAKWVQGGRIELGGELPVNTSGGLLSEAHVCGWNTICEMAAARRGRRAPDPGRTRPAMGTLLGRFFHPPQLTDPEENRMEADAQKPVPRLTPDNRTFWESCRQHRLVLPWCEDCDRPHWPPGPVCPFCFGDGVSWKEVSGRGVVSSWVVIHKAWLPAFEADLPYNAVQVELEEGVRLTGNILGLSNDKLSVGLPVEVVFDDVTPTVTLPRFRPR